MNAKSYKTDTDEKLWYILILSPLVHLKASILELEKDMLMYWEEFMWKKSSLKTGNINMNPWDYINSLKTPTNNGQLSNYKHP